jgi:hypothetical protein
MTDGHEHGGAQLALEAPVQDEQTRPEERHLAQESGRARVRFGRQPDPPAELDGELCQLRFVLEHGHVRVRHPGGRAGAHACHDIGESHGCVARACMQRAASAAGTI